ncbi:SDR family NAD(P)-dependent oxidoreductase [Mycolicibacterium mengxianglii]|uniref:SDR family NAD(P)-dependent oxidoreductase n=1 Tax=Mycolicibacterium mengxianglii TaxID=2736649 RepID=UPI0018EECDF3|nr:SDR family NAD(P)-dependent oxidoreductase [Mycolicibacterium mengxianglii]
MDTHHNQHPLGSGFTAASTVDDVLQGIDLAGTNVVVTGGHTGLGLQTTRALTAAGASVTVGARRVDRATAALSDIPGVEIGELDLVDVASVDGFVSRWLESDRPLHVLINNAGLPAPAEVLRDTRGYEAQFATNHLGHFQLTLGLLPALRAAHGARVVNVSSGAQRFSDIHWDDVHLTSGYDPNVAYAQSKTANVLFAVELDRRWSADGIRGYAVHPGVVVGTNVNGAAGQGQLRAMGLIDDTGQPIIRPETGRKTPQQGAATIVFAATSPLLADIGGVYLKDNDISALAAEPLPMTFDPDVDIPGEVAPHSIDPESAARLWELSEELLA